MIGRSFKGTRRLLVAVCAVGLVAMVWSAAAVAGEPPAPGYHVFGSAFPAEELPPGGEGSIELHVYNDGAATTSGEGPTLIDTLPEGLTATGGEISEGGSVSAAGGACSGEHVVVCHLPVIPAEESRFVVIIPVRVAASAGGEALDRARIEGGGAALVSSATVPAAL